VLKKTIADDRRSSPLSVAKISIVFVVGNMPHVGGSAVVPDQRFVEAIVRFISAEVFDLRPCPE